MKRFRDELDVLTEKIEEISNEVKKIKKEKENNEEEPDSAEEHDSDEVLTNYIKSEWSTCNRLRGKVEWEGSDYFYNSYTTVPVSWGTFSRFIRSDECYCGQCEE